LVWRGATTGNGQRTKFVEKFIAEKDFDVGFSVIVEQENSKKFIGLERGVLDKESMLKNKYLLSLEGNDVSSGLKWMLMSNSVVFKPEAKYVSWALESHLLPYVHYIPVADDLSNVHEQLKWAKHNDETCQAISQKATEFMQHFTGYAEDTHSMIDKPVKSLLLNLYSNVLSQIMKNFSLTHCNL
jgi:hypothetical protein